LPSDSAPCRNVREAPLAAVRRVRAHERPQAALPPARSPARFMRYAAACRGKKRTREVCEMRALLVHVNCASAPLAFFPLVLVEEREEALSSLPSKFLFVISRAASARSRAGPRPPSPRSHNAPTTCQWRRAPPAAHPADRARAPD
jgi:hypothetical protein